MCKAKSTAKGWLTKDNWNERRRVGFAWQELREREMKFALKMIPHSVVKCFLIRHCLREEIARRRRSRLTITRCWIIVRWRTCWWGSWWILLLGDEQSIEKTNLGWRTNKMNSTVVMSLTLFLFVSIDKVMFLDDFILTFLQTSTTILKPDLFGQRSNRTKDLSVFFLLIWLRFEKPTVIFWVGKFSCSTRSSIMSIVG